jgi:hypothetical protein
MKTTKPEGWPNGVPVFDEIRIENTNHCSYSCFFCPRDKLTRDRGFMSMEDLEKVLSQFPVFTGQFDLHGFGEPLLDKNLTNKIRLAKSKWPTAKARIYSTLGIKLKEQQKEELIKSGLDIIEVSFYGTNKETYRSTHGVDGFELACNNLASLCKLNKDAGDPITIVIRDFPIHEDIKQQSASMEEMNNFRNWLSEIGVAEIHNRQLHNYGGGRTYNKAPTEGTCSITWGYRKRVLQVTWDLSIIPCCFDFNASIILGNLHQSNISEIFQMAKYNDFIKAHEINNLAQYPVCMNCERCYKM